jgi:hypothetical protein
MKLNLLLFYLLPKIVKLKKYTLLFSSQLISSTKYKKIKELSLIIICLIFL